MSWWRVVRAALGILGALTLLGAVAALAHGQPIPALWAIVLGIVLLGVAFFERGRYGSRNEAAGQPGPGLQRTDEVFIDPSTGQRTRVWFDPATGERSYQAER